MLVVVGIALNLVLIAVVLASAAVTFVFGGKSFGFGRAMRWLFMAGDGGVAVWCAFNIRFLVWPTDGVALFIAVVGVIAAVVSFFGNKLLRAAHARNLAQQGVAPEQQIETQGGWCEATLLASGDSGNYLLRCSKNVHEDAEHVYVNVGKVPTL